MGASSSERVGSTSSILRAAVAEAGLAEPEEMPNQSPRTKNAAGSEGEQPTPKKTKLEDVRLERGKRMKACSEDPLAL
eukprot:14653033-Alexandrium_andersonii.AAC.1